MTSVERESTLHREVNNYKLPRASFSALKYRIFHIGQHRADSDIDMSVMG